MKLYFNFIPRKRTENLAQLASSGTTLSSLYTLPVCTPSRAALLTGIYPFRYGLQRGFGDFTPNGLPTGLKLLPNYLKVSSLIVVYSRSILVTSSKD